MDFTLDSVARPARFTRVPDPRSAAKSARGEALRAERLARIRAYVVAEMADPDLCAHAAARALGMSVRGLHLVLSPTGESFGDLVQRRRLAACHAKLSRPDNAATIADIAFACGFNSLSSFYRAFRRVYGACPREAARTADTLQA